VGILGTSSGGHQAVLNAMRPHDPRYAAIELTDGPDVDATVLYVISCWGVLDPYARYFMAKERGRSELLESHDQYWQTLEAMQEGNPLQILERGEQAVLTPLLFVQGTEDANIPPGMAEKFVSLYAASGGHIESYIVEGMPHGYAGWPPDEAAKLLQRMKTFVASRLGEA
jgi:dipeptidyl aminopeptidase/acylaminoacyl peptidase